MKRRNNTYYISRKAETAGTILGSFFAVVFILGIWMGFGVGVYTLLLYGIESMTTWKCPNFWGGYILLVISVAILHSIFQRTSSK